MEYFIDLTEWETTTGSRGRGVGKEIRSRRVLKADALCWVIGTQRVEDNDAPLAEQSYYGNMRSLVLAMAAEGIDLNAALTRIVNLLALKTGIKSPWAVIPPLTGSEQQEAFGLAIDNVFGTSYMREATPTVLKRIFKVDAA
jgi:hypothetical protein